MMRILKFNQINESASYKEAKEIINTLDVVCDEFTDEEIEWRIFPNIHDLIKIKMIGLQLHGTANTNSELFVEVLVDILSDKQKTKIIDIFSQLESYSISLGIPFYYRYQKLDFSTGKTIFRVSGNNVDRQPGEKIDKDYLFYPNIWKYRFYFNI